MLTSIDFGITIIDILRKTKDGKFIHKMMESNEKPSEKLVKELFEDLNFSKDIELIALTGGHHQLIGKTIDETPIFHVNEVDAIGEGGFYLSKLDAGKPALIVNSGSGTACILAKEGKLKDIKLGKFWDIWKNMQEPRSKWLKKY